MLTKLPVICLAQRLRVPVPDREPVKRIIEAHGGKIWAESEGEGKGTTVCFTQPVSGVQNEVPKY